MGGCGFADPIPVMFRVTNETKQVLVIRQRDIRGLRGLVSPGGTVTFLPSLKGCETQPWVATSEEGETVAEIPGGCAGHYWTIRGLADSSYE